MASPVKSIENIDKEKAELEKCLIEPPSPQTSIVHSYKESGPPSGWVRTKSNDTHMSKQNEDEDEEEEEEMAAVLPSPPDGGWGWVVVAASFLCNCILDGIAYTFGVILYPLCIYFDESPGTVAWVGSILCGVYLMSGPIVGGLVNKFGCRPVCMAGSFITCIAFLLSIFSVNVTMLMGLYGFLGGFGLGLIYLPAVVSVGYYFESKRALATGISVCGSGVGTFVFAPLATYLLEVYGWKGVNIIFAGLCLQCAVCGALMKPLEMSVIVDDIDDQEDETVGKFMVQLPDGTHRRQTDSQGDFHIASRKTSVLDVLHELPTITEQSVTKGQKHEYKSVQEVFNNQNSENKTSRKRTISENPNQKFKVSAVKTNKGQITRNTSAPQFNISDQHCYSNPRLTARVGSGLSFMSGSGSTLHMAPVVGSESRRGSARIMLSPLSRKDIFYQGSITSMSQPQDLDNQEQLLKSQFSISRASGLRSNKTSYISITGLGSKKQSYVSMPRGSLVNSSLALPLSIHYNRRRSGVSVRSQKSASQETLIVESDGGMLVVLKEMMNFSLLKDPCFLLFGISNVFGMMGFYTPFVYLPALASTYEGISVEDAAFLLSVIGISNTIGRVLAGWMSDFSWVNSLVVTYSALILSSLCVAAIPFCSTYGGFVTVALLFGFFVAAFVSVTSIVLVDLLGIDNLTNAFGILTLFRGSSSMIGPPIAGWVFEATQNYDISFFLSAGFLLMSGLIVLLVDILRRRRMADEEAKECDALDEKIDDM